MEHLDRHFWRQGWIQAPDDEWRATVTRLIAHDRWVHDGNYNATLPLRLERAELVVFVDTARSVCLYRVLKRRVKGNRVHDVPGCPERVDADHLRYVWRFSTTSRRRLLGHLESHPNVVRLRTRRQVREYLSRLAALAVAGGAAEQLKDATLSGSGCAANAWWPSSALHIARA